MHEVLAVHTWSLLSDSPLAMPCALSTTGAMFFILSLEWEHHVDLCPAHVPFPGLAESCSYTLLVLQSVPSEPRHHHSSDDIISDVLGLCTLWV